MKSPRIVSSRCLHCGERMRDGRVQPHCMTDACNRGYAEYVAIHQVRREGACEVWAGKVTKRKTPIISVRVGENGTKDGLRKDHRVLDVRFELAGRERGAFRQYRNLCGTPLCVTVEHNEVRAAEPVEPEGLKGHLDPTPLQRRLDLTSREIPHGVYAHMRECRERGWISVGKVDEICCDVLGIHPVELYGEEFFTA